MARLLDPDSDLNAQLEVLTAEGVATSAIEGERFDPNAVRCSLARRLGLPTAGLPAPPRRVEGLVDVLIDATQKLNRPFTVKMLGDWQAALFPMGHQGWPRSEPVSCAGPRPPRQPSSCCSSPLDSHGSVALAMLPSTSVAVAESMGIWL
jgi:hypothetical protein